MKMNRRDLLKIGVTQLMLVALPESSDASTFQTKTQNRLSILQGATDESKTQFSVHHNVNIELKIVIKDSKANTWYADKSEIIEHKGLPEKITKFFVSGLYLNETFELVVINAETNLVLDTREFKMLDPDLEKVKFALCSCMDERFHDPKIWKNLVSKSPDLIFFLGDFVYADRGIKGPANPHHLWKRFSEVRQTLEIFFTQRLIPILATWDDHDFGLNNSHSENYPYVLESQKNFLSFFAQDEGNCANFEKGPGISSALRFNSQTFLLLDDRSFRKPKKSKNRYAHWGEDQERWMLNLMKSNPGTFWLMNGTQIFPDMALKESVAYNHPVQLKGLLKELKSIPSKVIFASGDVHYSEISQIESEALGYETYEITSSSIHSKSMPGSPHVISNPRRMIATGARNFIIVESINYQNGVQMKVTSYNSSGSILFQKSLTV